jgi:hypothetical protein
MTLRQVSNRAGPPEQGRSYASGGDHTRAIAEFDEAIRLDPKLVAAYWQRGVSPPKG